MRTAGCSESGKGGPKIEKKMEMTLEMEKDCRTHDKTREEVKSRDCAPQRSKRETPAANGQMYQGWADGQMGTLSKPYQNRIASSDVLLGASGSFHGSLRQAKLHILREQGGINQSSASYESFSKARPKLASCSCSKGTNSEPGNVHFFFALLLFR